MRKKFTTTILAVATALLVAGCGNAGDVANQLSAEADTSKPAAIHGEPADPNDTTTTSDEFSSNELSSEIVTSGETIFDFPTEPGVLLTAFTESDEFLTPPEYDNNLVIVDYDGDILFYANYEELLEIMGLPSPLLIGSTPICYDRGALILQMENHGPNGSWEGWKYLALYPQQGKCVTITESQNCLDFTLYEDKLYSFDEYYDWDICERNYIEVCYEREEDAIEYTLTECNGSEYCEINKEYSRVFRPQRTADQKKMSYTEILETIGYYLCNNNGDYIKYYADKHIENLPELTLSAQEYFENRYINVFAYDKNFIVYETKPDDIKFGKNCYIIGNDTGIPISFTKEYNNLLAYNNGVVYYDVESTDSDGTVNATIYAYNAWFDETFKIYTAQSVPGASNGYTSGVTFFQMFNGNIFTLNHSGDSSNWFVAKSSEDGYHFMDTEVVFKSFGWTELGAVKAIAYTVICPECGKYDCEYSSAQFIADSSIPFSDKINATLLDIEKKCTPPEHTAKDLKAICATEHLDTFSTYRTDEYIHFQRIFIDAKLIYDNYLAVYYDSYEYSVGGAHGSPDKVQYLFDLRTGELVDFFDFYKGTEEELKDLAATVTANDAQKQIDQIGFCYYFSSSYAGVYTDTYNYTTFDSFTGFFEEDGYHIQLPPYAVAPFSSGFMGGVIPYKFLGFTLAN